MRPTVADYRTRKRMILRRPVGERPSVTAEAAGSSPVVPAIFSKEIRLSIHLGNNRFPHKRGAFGFRIAPGVNLPELPREYLRLLA